MHRNGTRNEPSRSVQRWTLIATILASGIVFLDSTVVNVALPSIGRELETGLSGLQWIVDGYVLTLASLLILGGSLGDRYGRRRMMIVGLVAFGVASAACGLAPTLSWLIAGRLVQGMGGALMVPDSLALLRATYPAGEARGQAIGQWSGWSGITTVVGPLLGGWLVDTFSWRWVFSIGVPVVLGAVVVMLLRVPESRSEGEPGRLDWPGAALVTAGLGGLAKQYDGQVAVDALDLTVRAGEVFGLLGPNGSGKTTTILMLLGLTEPTAGSVQVLGLNPARQPLSVKARVGYMPDEVGFYDELSARANLSYIARLNGLSRGEAPQRIDEVLARMGLSEVADRLVLTYSRGMRRRLGVADVLLKEPQLVIMDEPTQGLDPEGARAFLRIIRDLREEGITVLLSSHLLHQVQAVCDRVGLFRKGRMVLVGSVTELARRVLGTGYHIQLQADGPATELAGALQALPGVVGVRQENGNRFEVAATSDLRAEAATAAIASGGRLLGLDIEEPSLDDIYTRYFEEVDHDSTD